MTRPPLPEKRPTNGFDPHTSAWRNGVPCLLVAAARADGDISIGSGFVVTQDGLVVTNYHVVEGATEIALRTSADAIFRNVELIDTDTDLDIAILFVSGLRRPTLRLDDSTNVEIGENIIVIGNPHALENTLTRGAVSGRRRGKRAEYIQTDAAVSPGSSGGPILNMRGEVVAVVVAQHRNHRPSGSASRSIT